MCHNASVKNKSIKNSLVCTTSSCYSLAEAVTVAGHRVADWLFVWKNLEALQGVAALADDATQSHCQCHHLISPLPIATRCQQLLDDVGVIVISSILGLLQKAATGQCHFALTWSSLLHTMVPWQCKASNSATSTSRCHHH